MAPKHPKIHFLTAGGSQALPKAGAVSDLPSCSPSVQGQGRVPLPGQSPSQQGSEHPPGWAHSAKEGRAAPQLREFGPSSLRGPSHSSPGLCAGAGLTLGSLAWEGRGAVQHKDFRSRERSPLNTLTDIYAEPRLLRLSWSRADCLPPATPLTNFHQIYSFSNGAT